MGCRRPVPYNAIFTALQQTFGPAASRKSTGEKVMGFISALAQGGNTGGAGAYGGSAYGGNQYGAIHSAMHSVPSGTSTGVQCVCYMCIDTSEVRFEVDCSWVWLW